MIIVIGCFIIGLIFISIMGLLVGLSFGSVEGGELVFGVCLVALIPLAIGIYHVGSFVSESWGLM
jgi:hypothetical protein